MMLNIDNIGCLDQEVKKRDTENWTSEFQRKNRQDKTRDHCSFFGGLRMKVYLGKSTDPKEVACSALLCNGAEQVAEKSCMLLCR